MVFGMKCVIYNLMIFGRKDNVSFCMKALLDDIKILICGGVGVGKTTLARRLAASSSSSADASVNATVFRFDIALKINSPSQNVEQSSLQDSKLSMRVKLIDVGGNILNCKGVELEQFTRIVRSVEGIFIVVDVTNALSLKDFDIWLEFLADTAPKSAFRYLLVHKADLPLMERVITARNLDIFVNQCDIEEWGYTVGHPDLKDLDINRSGQWTKQSSIETMMEKLITQITQKRRYNFYKFLPIPFRIRYLNSQEIDYRELDKLLIEDESTEK